jgi:ABC-type transport system substrate-binding protein
MKWLALFLFCSTQALAMYPYSKKSGEVYAGMSGMKKGGSLFLHLASNPKSLNPLLNNSAEVTDVIRMIYSPLMYKDDETGEYFPALAEKVDVSKDRKTYTFTLRKTALWHDGTPITADDAEFTYQILMDSKVEAAPKRAYFGSFRFEKVDAQTFRLVVDSPGVNTLVNFNDDFLIFQKKQFAAEPNFNKAKGIIQPVGSGPYRLKSFSRDQKLELERVKGWFGEGVASLKNLFNFDSLVYRIIPDNTLAYEKFMKGEINLITMNAEMYGNRVKGVDQVRFGTDPNSGKSVWAKSFRTEAPAFYHYVGWNLKSPLFSSKKTRQALAQLIDYDLITDKVFYGTSIRCYSPFGSLTPNTAPDQKSKAFAFNPKKGIEQLKADGWADSDGDSVLDRMVNGKKLKFEFTIRYNSENPMRAKVAQIVKEQFKKAGIQVNVQAMEWNSFIAETENRNFDAIVLGWAKGNFHPEAGQIWHSQSYANKGSNFIGYSNPEVDALIAQSNQESDLKKRFKIMQKIGALIYDDQPYAFLVEQPGFIMGAHSNIKAKKWALRYQDSPGIMQYSIE